MIEPDFTDLKKVYVLAEIIGKINLDAYCICVFTSTVNFSQVT